jgi:hypothetical protein
VNCDYEDATQNERSARDCVKQPVALFCHSGFQAQFGVNQPEERYDPQYEEEDQAENLLVGMTPWLLKSPNTSDQKYGT